MTKTLAALTVIVVIGAAGFAGQAQNRMHGTAQQTGHPMGANTELVTLLGTVIETHWGSGQGMPRVTFKTNAGDLTIMIGPFWALATSSFEIKVGQTLEIKAFKDPLFANTYVAAEIKDPISKAVLVLRDSAGTPGQSGPGRGMMRGRMGGGQGMQGLRGMQGSGVCASFPSGLDANTKTTLNGTVDKVNAAAGQGSPSFTLLISGKPVTVLACPYRLLVQAGFVIEAGHHLSVVGYPVPDAAGTYLAAEINNLTTGKTITLR